jgi:heptaprenylglyceryl phosphate synthase
MKHIYGNILASILKGEKLLAVLMDPDKTKLEGLSKNVAKINQSVATHIFVGGSTVEDNATDVLVTELKKISKLPVVLFPGDITQITNKADGILFLSLISGRNPDYLIGKHVKSISKFETQIWKCYQQDIF